MTTSFAETIILMWWRERNSKNKWNRERRSRKKKTYQSRRPMKIHLVVLCDEAAKQMLTINGAIPWYVSDWCDMAFFLTLWCFLAPNFCGMTAITFTSSTLFLCPISFTIKLSEKHEAVINYRGGKSGQPHAATPLYRRSCGDPYH